MFKGQAVRCDQTEEAYKLNKDLFLFLQCQEAKKYPNRKKHESMSHYQMSFSVHLVIFLQPGGAHGHNIRTGAQVSWAQKFYELSPALSSLN